MSIFYQFGVNFYVLLVRIAALWNRKAKLWVDGRKDVWTKLEQFNEKEKTVKRYWFHCASLGEFEQGRPIIEALKAREACSVVITFFSPSGYEIRKDYELADLIIYLPKDSRSNAKKLLNAMRPDKIFFIKYEFWARYIFEAKKRAIPIYAVSVIFRKDQLFFKWYGGFMRRVLKSFDKIFVQEKNSQVLLDSIGVKSIVAGDTRFDRVLQNAKNVQDLPAIKSFVAGKKVLVVGSSWEEDEFVLRDLFKRMDPSWRIIIAPHELSQKRIDTLLKIKPGQTVLYSSLKTRKENHEQFLIIDNMGMLMHVYQFGDVAYVGGAFGKGLHNILEPAAFGIPVIFGANYKKFNEANLFIQKGFAASVQNQAELLVAFNRFEQAGLRNEILHFMNEMQGSTAIILSKT